MKKTLKRGFTLIELLVVIAIIGILASIILASLATARGKGSDATIKSDMGSVAQQMELYNSSNNTSYLGGCAATASSTPAAGAGTILAAAVTQAASQVSGVTLNVTAGTAGTYQTVTCHDSSAAWAAEAPLSTSASGKPVMWCVDSNGDSKQETSNLAGSGTNQFLCL